MNIKHSPKSATYDTVVMRRIADAVPALPPALRKVAEYVLRHPMKTATMTIEDLASETGTSPAAVNRLARVVDYGGFTGLKSELLSTLRDALSPVEKLKVQLGQSHSGRMLAEMVRTGIGNLRQVGEANTEESFNQAVDAIAAAKRVYTLGFGNSSYLAAAAASRLLPYFGATFALGTEGGNEHAAYRLTSIGADDALLAISLPRYSRDTVQLARFAGERGATVIAVTDSPAAPLLQAAHHVVYAASEHPMFASSSVAATMVLESLVAAVMARNKEVVRISSDLTESVLSYLHLGGRPEPRREAETAAKKSNRRK